MKVAVVGSRTLSVENLNDYLPDGTTEIISGGAKGIDTCAKEYCTKNNIKITEFFPEYKLYGKGAPIVRNRKIIDEADFALIFWDGKSRGTKFVINECEKQKKQHKVSFLKTEEALDNT